MTPIWKKISKKGISLLLVLSLFVGTAGTVSANAAVEDRAEASTVEEVVTDPAETALDEVEQPAAEETEPEAKPEPPTAEEAKSEPPTEGEPPAAEEAKSEPPAEEETLVPTLPEAEELPKAGEQEQTQAAEPVVHKDGMTTVGELKTFMNKVFEDASFRQATLSAVLKYYGLNTNAADDEVIHNTKKSDNGGPDDFASPEEVLGWLAGKTQITVNDPKNLEGAQYLSTKIKYRGSKYAQIIVENKPAINMQTFWGRSNNVDNNPDVPGHVLHVSVDIHNSIMWPMSDRGAIHVREWTLPSFWGQMRTWDSGITVVDGLTYLRTGSEDKRLVINSELVRNNGENTTKIGTLREKFQNLELLETTDTGWIVKPHGQSAIEDESDQYYDLWENYGAGQDGNNGIWFSINYTYKVTANYYSSVNMDPQNQVYGGFTFHKTTADGNVSLAGATYVVCKDGKYLSEVGGANQTAVFTDDIAQAKRFVTDQTGSFVVSPIPKGDYEVIEVEAPSGYRLDATPVPVTVTVDRSGISTACVGAEGNSLTVNADKTTLTPNWKDGDYNEMTVTGGTKTETADLFIRNGSEGGKDITLMEGELLNAADPNYTTLQEPVFTIKNLKGEVVKDGLNGLAELKAYINTELIAADAMQTEYDSYEITASQDLIYYDTTSAAKCVAAQTDDALPVNVELTAEKVFTGGTLEMGDFQFDLIPDGTVDGDPVGANGVIVTNKADGTVSFGTLSYTKPGTYTYTLKETQNWYKGQTANDITFDTSTHTVVVTVTEAEAAPGVTNGLTATVTMDGVKIGQEVTSVNSDKADAFELATFENILDKDMGSLTVTKTVAGDLGDQNADWHFTVTLNDNTINGTYGDMTFANGVAQIVLKHGESKTATDLPAGTTYTVVETEANQNGYATTFTGDTGAIEKDQTKTAAFTNTYNSPLPITGGMGTNVFYQLGGAVISAAVFLLIATKKRKRHTVQ